MAPGVCRTGEARIKVALRSLKKGSKRGSLPRLQSTAPVANNQDFHVRAASEKLEVVSPYGAARCKLTWDRPVPVRRFILADSVWPWRPLTGATANLLRSIESPRPPRRLIFSGALPTRLRMSPGDSWRAAEVAARKEGSTLRGMTAPQVAAYSAPLASTQR